MIPFIFILLTFYCKEHSFLFCLFAYLVIYLYQYGITVSYFSQWFKICYYQYMSIYINTYFDILIVSDLYYTLEVLCSDMLALCLSLSYILSKQYFPGIFCAFPVTDLESSTETLGFF